MEIALAVTGAVAALSAVFGFSAAVAWNLGHDFYEWLFGE